VGSLQTLLPRPAIHCSKVSASFKSQLHSCKSCDKGKFPNPEASILLWTIKMGFPHIPLVTEVSRT
jgi:hypothetical protein